MTHALLCLVIACIKARSDKRVDVLDCRQVDLLASIYIVKRAQKLNKFDFDDDAQFYFSHAIVSRPFSCLAHILFLLFPFTV